MSTDFNAKKVFVTGADGFIGSHLVEHLVREGASVKALTYYNSWNSIGWLSDIPQSILNSVEVLRGDIRDAEFIHKAIKNCEYVFHLSSLIGIPYSYSSPRSYLDTNITGALNVLEGCRNSSSLLRLLHTSTSEVYGTAQTVPISEDHPLVGQSPYSATKIGADKLVESYYLSFALPVVTARPFNTFGPRQTARAVIPTITSQLLSGCSSLQLGALTPTRDFTYVLDTVRALCSLIGCDSAEGQVVNIGTGLEWSIEETARTLMEIVGVEVPITCDNERVRPKNSEVNRLIADNSRITSMTNWRPEHSFRRGLEQTVNWIKENLHHFEPTDYSV
ncbi:GDP-mannose 4,6-dehydratase [Methylophaga sp.]|uniref:GDP-mannose 4,6-dehydratase n=1 Tax=Methylophaga sp. TaxID=2024840 RepID=UPI003A9341F6